MEFNYQFDEYSENFFAGRDYCLLGNGFLQVVVQLKGNFGASGNAILLNLISADEYRSRRFWLLSHHAFKEIPSCVAILAGGRLFCADSRQIGTRSLTYELSFDDGFPALVVQWDAFYELDRSLTPRISDAQIEDVSLAPGNIGLAEGKASRRQLGIPARVTEKIWCPNGLCGFLREVRIENRGASTIDDIEVWYLLAPNKLFLPSGKMGPGGQSVLAGYWNGARQFIALAGVDPAAQCLLSEYPEAVDAILSGQRKALDRVDNPFMGVHLAAGLPAAPLAPGASATRRFAVVYGKTEEEALAGLRKVRGAGVGGLATATVSSGDSLTQVRTGIDGVDTLYRAAKAGIRASVSCHEKPGRINSGILQYDTEWSRDVDFVAAAASMNGQHEIARSIIGYALENLMDVRGHCFCGSAWEGRDRDYQIDTNGIRLWAIWLYVAFTGDEEPLRLHWPRICALIDAFFDTARWVEKVGMIASTRDCWERWRNCGLEPGFELHHQHWSAVGLEKAAELAALAGHRDIEERCRARSRRIWQAVLSSPRFALVRSGHFIKRRTLRGTVQLKAYAYRGASVGYLEPDTSELQPILSGLVDGRSSLARATLGLMQTLWNQDGLWSCGGYTRYNITSDPDQSSGPWPGVTLMVARAALLAARWATFDRALDWVVRMAEPTWTLFEHFDYGAPDKTNRRWYRGGIIPWLSYAEPSMLVVQDLLGFRPGLRNVVLRPSLPPQAKRVSASVVYRGRKIGIEISNRGGPLQSVRVDGKPYGEHDARGAIFPPFTREASIRMTFGPKRSRGE